MEKNKFRKTSRDKIGMFFAQYKENKGQKYSIETEMMPILFRAVACVMITLRHQRL